MLARILLMRIPSARDFAQVCLDCPGIDCIAQQKSGSVHALHGSFHHPLSPSWYELHILPIFEVTPLCIPRTRIMRRKVISKSNFCCIHEFFGRHSRNCLRRNWYKFNRETHGSTILDLVYTSFRFRRFQKWKCGFIIAILVFDRRILWNQFCGTKRIGICITHRNGNHQVLLHGLQADGHRSKFV